MTTKYVSPTGVDTNDGNSAGAPYLTIDKAFDNLSGTSDDTVYLADGNYAQTTNLVTSGGTKTGGSITLRSSSGDPALCSISGNATLGNWYLLRNDETGVAFTVRDITFKDHTRNDGASVIFWASQDLTITNCVLDNLTITCTSGAPTGFIRNYHATDPANLTIAGLTVRNCTWSTTGATTGREGALFSTNKFGGVGAFSGINIESLAVSYDSNYQFNGICFHRGTNNWSGTNSFAGITINGAHASYGIIKLESLSGAYKHTISGTMTIDGCNTTITGANSNYGMINVSANDTLTITADLEIKNIVNVVAAADYGGVANLHADSRLIIRGDNIKIHNNTSATANGWVGNAGGSCYFGNIQLYSNVAKYGGGIYNAPKTATVEIAGCLIYNNTASEQGGGIFAQDASGTNTTNITNCTLYGNLCSAASGGDGMFLGELSGATAVYNVHNTICRNQTHNDEIRAGGTGNPELNITYSNILGGAAACTGEDTYTNNVDVDPLFVDATGLDFRLQSASTMRRAGQYKGHRTDYRGKRFAASAPTIGAFEFGAGDAATTRAARV